MFLDEIMLEGIGNILVSALIEFVDGLVIRDRH